LTHSTDQINGSYFLKVTCPSLHIWPVTSEHGEKVDHGPLSESMYTACSTHLTMGLACMLSITREYMEHGGHLPANQREERPREEMPRKY
jgi:hypothetical protein